MPTGQFMNRSYIELPGSVASEILQKAQESSAIMRLARKVALPGDGSTIPMITGDPVADWVTETGTKPVDKPTLGKKVMQAHKLAVIVPFSNEFKRDRARLFEECIRRLPNALGKKFDTTCFFGPANALANFDDLSTATKQALDGVGSTVYGGLVAADTDISEHGGIVNGYVFSPQGRGVLLGALDSTNRPIFVPTVHDGGVNMILGAPTYFAQSAYKAGAAAAGSDPAIPDVIGFAGDWDHAMWGTVEGVKIDISDEATLVYKDELEQDVTINLWQQNMFAVRAEIEVGFVAEVAYFNALTRAHS